MNWRDRRNWLVTALHNYHGANKVYVGRVEKIGDLYYPVFAWGPTGMKVLNEKKHVPHVTEADALLEVTKQLHKKIREGYEDVEEAGYTGGLTLAHILDKILDLSNLVGYAAAQPSVTARHPTPQASVAPAGRRRGRQPAEEADQSGRVRRVIRRD
jgi:hypothetical protein